MLVLPGSLVMGLWSGGLLLNSVREISHEHFMQTIWFYKLISVNPTVTIGVE